MCLTSPSIMLWFLWAAYWLMLVTDGESIAMTRHGDDSMNRRRGWIMIDRLASEVNSNWQNFQLNLSACPVCSSTAGWKIKYFPFCPPAGTCLTPSLYLPPTSFSLTVLYSLVLKVLPCFRSSLLENVFTQAGKWLLAAWFLVTSEFCATKNKSSNTFKWGWGK